MWEDWLKEAFFTGGSIIMEYGILARSDTLKLMP